MQNIDLLRLVGTTYPFTPQLYSALGVLSPLGQRAFILRHVSTHQLKAVRKYLRWASTVEKDGLALELLFTGIQFALLTDFRQSVMVERLDRYGRAEGKWWNGIRFQKHDCIEMIRDQIDDCLVLVEPFDHDVEPAGFEQEIARNGDALVDLGIALALLHGISLTNFRSHVLRLNDMPDSS